MTFKPSSPDKEEVKLFLSDSGVQLTEFVEYSFNSNFLSPTDGFSFTVGASKLTEDVRLALIPGAEVMLLLNGRPQATGYIDSITKSASRSAGTEWRIEGRDRFGPVVDAQADPLKSFKPNMTLLDAVKELFGPFGWKEDDQFAESNEANIELKTGVRLRQKRKASEAKGFGRRAVKQAKLHRYRPYPREGVFEFASRISQRFGFWIWPTADGTGVVVSTPDFTSEPLYRLVRSSKGGTNVLDGSVKFDLTDQPTIIVADGYSQAGEFGRSRIKVITANQAVFTDDPEFAATFTRFKGAKVIDDGIAFQTPVRAPRNRVLYLQDGESQTIEQLEHFVRRELALLQRKSLEAHYTVEGHGQVTNAGFVPWTVDTTVDVYDEVAGLTERLWVLGRTFNKSRSGGTTTELDLIRRNTLVFSSTGK